MLDFLARVRKGALTRLDGTVAVVGGGNSALDSARTALRLGAREVLLLYRRSRAQMPAHGWEVEQALADGVRLETLVAPVSIQGARGRVRTLRLVRMELGEPDASGRPRPVPVPGSETEIEVDHVVMAIGQQAEPGDLGRGLARTKWGTIRTDPVTQETDRPGLLAGGDAATGASTVVAAFGAGKRAAESIDRRLRGVDVAAGRRDAPARSRASLRPTNGTAPRARPPELPLARRTASFAEIVGPLCAEAARAEADRCLGCGLVHESAPSASGDPRGDRTGPIEDRARLVVLEVDRAIAARVGGIRVQSAAVTEPIATVLPPPGDEEVILCRCERVTVGQVRRLIRSGATDLNRLKAVLGIAMGACGAKTCGPILESVLVREGVPRDRITRLVQRPLTAEIEMGLFAGLTPPEEAQG